MTRPVPRIAKELAESNGFLLARLGLTFKARAIARIEREGFEAYHYSLLAMLSEGARETQAAIADALELDPSRLVTLLDALEGRGLLVRQRDPDDRRRHVVSITPAGERELLRLRGIAREVDDEFFGALGDVERATLHGLLQQLAAAHDPHCPFVPPVEDRTSHSSDESRGDPRSQLSELVERGGRRT
jgi:DNA-binding MarR family transcriptional regulator